MGTTAGATIGAAVARLAGKGMPQTGSIPGRPKRTGTMLLQLGARLMQRKNPLHHFDTWLVGFHPLKERPHVHVEAHHFCHIVNEDFIQCVVFDGPGQGARLTGVEFIISERVYETLPEEERPNWHPHNYEILSGQLVAPGIPGPLEDRLMERLLNSYGKTWQFWMSGQGDSLPLGDACLAWSFSRDGQLDARAIIARNELYHIDGEDKRKRREPLSARASAQRGVDELDAALGGNPERPAGVIDLDEAAWRAGPPPGAGSHAE